MAEKGGNRAQKWESICKQKWKGKEKERNEESRKKKKKERQENEEKGRRRAEERRREKEEIKKQFQKLKKQNYEIKNTVKEKFKEIESFQKTIEARLKTTEAMNKETSKQMNINQEKCENRSRMMWEEINRIQEGTQDLEKRMNELKKQMEENARRNTGRGMTDREKQGVEKLPEELKKELDNLKKQQSKIMQSKIIYCNTNTQMNKFDGNINKLHPIIFIRMLRNKTKHLVKFEDMRELTRESLERDGLIWFPGKEHEIHDLENFEMLFLRKF